jgi:hypothetical protein
MGIERKYERDVDVLLAEEFAVNPFFAEKFKSLTKFANEVAVVSDFWVSKSNNMGESDLIVLYECSDKRRFAILIEDKVDARLQSDQAERYQKRARSDVAKGDYEDFAVVLCAPRYYLDNHSDLSSFEHHISLEQIADILSAPDDARANYKADFLRTAGTKKLNAWKRQDDAATNAFWDAAYELASRDFRILEMKRLKVTKGTSWITFRPRGIAPQSKRLHLGVDRRFQEKD